MKSINPRLLKVGNIFTKSYILHGREAFEVLEEPNEKTILIRSRLTGDEKRMRIENLSYVILLHEKL